MRIAVLPRATVEAWDTAAPGWPIGAACIVSRTWPAHVVAGAERGKVRVRFPGGAPDKDLPDELDIDPDALTTPPGAPYLALNLEDGRGKWRMWSARDLVELHTVWGTKPDEEIAARLDRSVDACRVALWRWFGSKTARKDGTLTGRQVAQIMGVDEHYVIRNLIGRRLLRARKTRLDGKGPRFKWAISEDVLETFLREHPAHYHWRQVTGQPWATIAREVHEADPLLTRDEAAELLCLHPGSITQRVNLGILPAVWSNGGRIGGNRGWLFRRSDVLAQIDRPAAPPTFPERDEWLTGRGLVTPPEAARLLGVHPCTVYRWVRQGALPAERLRAHGKDFVGILRSAIEAAA